MSGRKVQPMLTVREACLPHVCPTCGGRLALPVQPTPEALRQMAPALKGVRLYLMGLTGGSWSGEELLLRIADAMEANDGG